MKKIHEKSHKCKVKPWKIGGRRRKCSSCGHTWSVWKKQRGRKRLSPSKKLLEKIFVDRQRLRQSAAVRLRRLSLSGLSYRLSSSIRRLTDKFTFKSKRLPQKDHILLIDALWYKFNKQRFTVYFMAVKPVGADRVTFLPPVQLSGKESLQGWKTAVATLPKSLKGRIKALVSDGWRGVTGFARSNGWKLQRCHFHLLAQLQINRGKWKKLPDQSFREEIYQTVRTLLVAKVKVLVYKERLIRLTHNPQCPRRLRSIALDFLDNIHYFRTYLNQPHLKLPKTTNSMEAMNRQIREACRHQRTPESLERWVQTYLKYHPTIVCNDANHTQN